MLYIRSDANATIGTGHMMRCLAIAQAVEEQGQQVTFIVADETGAQYILERGYPCIKLDSVWNDLDVEIEKILNLIRKYSIQQLFLDSYYVTTKYLRAMNQVTEVTYLDDLHQIEYPCKRLINYAIYAGHFLYSLDWEIEELYLGCKYTPLRKEFQNLPKKITKSNVENVLVLSGGTDTYHFLLQMLEVILKEEKFSDIQFHIVSGKYASDDSKMIDMIEAKGNIRLYKNLYNLSHYMQQADVAISAGGTTLYELCACGTPTICYALADNQLENVLRFHKEGYMYYGGDIRCDHTSIYKIYKKLMQWLEYPEERQTVSLKMQELVDGNGASRIAKILTEKRD